MSKGNYIPRPDRFVRATPPSVTDDETKGFRVGDSIVRGDNEWRCIVNTTNAAKWILLQPGIGPTASAFGDSIAAGTGASTPDLCFRRLVESANGWTTTDRSMSGKQLADFADNIFSLQVPDDHVAYLLLGFNDMRDHGADATALTCFERMLYSSLAWLAMPTSKVLKAQSAAITYTGAWSNSASVYGGGLVKYSTADGATATLKLYGSVLYINMLQYTGFSRALNITVDGVDKGTYHGSDFTAPNSGRAYGPYLIRIAGLTEAEHTVVLTVVNGAGTVYFAWAAGAAGKRTKDGPYVYVGNCLRMNATGYTVGGASWNNGSEDAVRQHNDKIRPCASTLNGDGLPVTLVDACAWYNLTGVDADNIHPNDTGHAQIADPFLAAMRIR